MKYANKKDIKNVNVGNISKNIIKRKPNWTATILVILILGIMYCHFGSDLMAYSRATKERAELAKQAEQSVLYETGLDMEAIESKRQDINQSIQDLKDGTDLGELFAENDLTEEGRKKNATVITTITVSIIGFVAYVVLNFFRTIWWAVSGRKTADNANCQRENIS